MPLLTKARLYDSKICNNIALTKFHLQRSYTLHSFKVMVMRSTYPSSSMLIHRRMAKLKLQ